MEIFMQSRRGLAARAAFAFALLAGAAHAQPLPAIGGEGGGQFMAPCPQGEVLSGLELWTGDDIDAIQPICIPAHAGQFQSYPVKFGGEGGVGPLQVVCPNEAPVIVGMEIGAEGVHTITVNNIHLYCGRAVATVQRPAYAAAVFDAPRAKPDCGFLGTNCDPPQRKTATQWCPEGSVAVGINGRSGIWLDALGMICGAPPAPPSASGIANVAKAVAESAKPTLKAQGRVKVASAQSQSPPRDICEMATEARARNSPAAPGLEAKCAEQKSAPVDLVALHARGAELADADPLAAELRDQQKGPARRGFEIGLAAAEGQTFHGPGKQRIHDMLSPAEQDAYSLAVDFSLSRNRQKIVDLAPRGAEIARMDPLATEFRNQHPDGPARLGFDIGMAAAEGQTAPGPGKQKIHDSLNPSEQGGFADAVAFSLERNKNIDAAKKGAIIARADKMVAVLRAAETDVFYRLGFDIATGIFGDPKLGAAGNTATGPGSLAIRNGLSVAGQRGFDAAVKFHLARRYAP